MTEEKDNSRETIEAASKAAIKENLKKLAERRERGELEQANFPLENIFYINDEGYGNRPLDRKDLDRQALVLSPEEFHQLGYLDLLLPDGRELTIFAQDFCSDPKDTETILVIFPEDLGSNVSTSQGSIT